MKNLLFFSQKITPLSLFSECIEIENHKNVSIIMYNLFCFVLFSLCFQQMKKGDTIQRFLQKCLENLKRDFHELK